MSHRVVVEVRRPPRYGLPLGALAAALFVAVIVAAHRIVPRIVAVVGLLGLTWVIAVASAANRRGAIVATEDGLESGAWRLRWDRVDRIVVGQTVAGRAITIEPVRAEDIELPRSRVLAINRRLNDAAGLPQILIPQRRTDRPLEEIVADFERLAGRPLG